MHNYNALRDAKIAGQYEQESEQQSMNDASVILPGFARGRRYTEDEVRAILRQNYAATQGSSRNIKTREVLISKNIETLLAYGQLISNEDGTYSRRPPKVATMGLYDLDGELVHVPVTEVAEFNRRRKAQLLAMSPETKRSNEIAALRERLEQLETQPASKRRK
jgi:hypothetical protein